MSNLFKELKFLHLVIVIIFFIACNFFAAILLRSYANHRLIAVVDSVNIQRNFQGLVLDTSGIGTLVLNIMEKQGLFYVSSIQVGDDLSKGQQFQAEFKSSKKWKYIELSILQISLNYNSESAKILVTLMPSTLIVFLIVGLSFLTSAFIGFGIGLFQFLKNKEAEFLSLTKISEIATGVAHDIKSPLATLEALVSCNSELNHTNNLLFHSAVKRIKDIADSLLTEYKISFKKDKNELLIDSLNVKSSLSKLLDEIIQEKRIQFNNVAHINLHIEQEMNIYSKINETEFSRVISNLINNAVESMEKNKIVNVFLSSCNEFNTIKISDRGCGIPDQILPQLMVRGKSFKKKKGHGLGLYQARECIKKWNGSIQINSEINQGTVVIIKLPQFNIIS